MGSRLSSAAQPTGSRRRRGAETQLESTCQAPPPQQHRHRSQCLLAPAFARRADGCKLPHMAGLLGLCLLVAVDAQVPSPSLPPRSPDSCATDQASLASRNNTLDDPTLFPTGWAHDKYCYNLRQRPCESTGIKHCLPEGKTCADYYSVSPASASTPGKHRLCHFGYGGDGSC
eukprot:scaffold127599_cov57-Phaeocystis_antarctica.AAC.1